MILFIFLFKQNAKIFYVNCGILIPIIIIIILRAYSIIRIKILRNNFEL